MFHRTSDAQPIKMNYQSMALWFKKNKPTGRNKRKFNGNQSTDFLIFFIFVDIGARHESTSSKGGLSARVVFQDRLTPTLPGLVTASYSTCHVLVTRDRQRSATKTSMI